MVNIFLDPYILACPEPSEGIDRFEQYINSMIFLQELKEVGWADIFISEKTSDILFETKSYPLWEPLCKIMSLLDVKYIQKQDVVNIVNSILSKSSFIERRLKIKEMLLNDVICQPDRHLSSRKSLFIDSYNSLMVYMCLLCQIEGHLEKDQILVTSDAQTNYFNANISGTIEECDFYENHTQQMTPCNVKGSFSACVNKNGLFASVDPIKIWADSDKIDDHRQSIHVYIFQKNIASDNEYREYTWSFGGQFLESARYLGFLDNQAKIEKLLRSCKETILEENLKDAHWLRIDSGPNSPPVTRARDKARAWRRDVDHEYHIHYWETGNGVEFASVVLHNDFSIPE